MSAFSIRHETPEDCENIGHILDLAFGGPAPGKLAEDLRKNGDVVISLVALNGKHMLGHIMLSRLKGPAKALILAPFAVHPDFQAKGIGVSLLRKALGQAKREGWALVFVLGDKGYYEHLGYAVKKGNPSSQGGEHFLMLSPEAEHASMAGPAVFPPPFRELA